MVHKWIPGTMSLVSAPPPPGTACTVRGVSGKVTATGGFAAACHPVAGFPGWWGWAQLWEYATPECAAQAHLHGDLAL